METTRKSVYPVNKLEVYDPEFLANISRPHQVSKHTLPIHQDEYVIRESKIDFLTKLGKFNDLNGPILDKINEMF